VKSIDIIEPDLCDPVEISEQDAFGRVGDGPRLDIATHVLLDDRLAREKMCMHIAPVRDELVVGQIGPTSDEYVYLEHVILHISVFFFQARRRPPSMID